MADIRGSSEVERQLRCAAWGKRNGISSQLKLSGFAAPCRNGYASGGGATAARLQAKSPNPGFGYRLPLSRRNLLAVSAEHSQLGETMSINSRNNQQPVQLSIDQAFELVVTGYRFHRARRGDEVRYLIDGQVYGAECTGRSVTLPEKATTTA
jgi:hypothetical protein